ncbi:hypothetical protein Vadar_000842 [Vaccinium darrowii]|uniref:Uncharacterized protein n=1 Tax=Vaccinium darrowii TaxID=229202 RepID=A0ACB7YSD1_9ERIC|nr:hypothetical protein Vadar_000842 [Vaccinium darrowii]
MDTTLPLRKTLSQRPPPPLPNSPIDPQNQPPNLVLQIEPPLPLPNALLLETPNQQPPELVPPPIEQPLGQLPLPNAQPQQQNNFDFPTLVLAFCLTGALEIAIQYRTDNTLIFHLLCLMVVFAFASIFVAKSIASKHLNAARKLDSVGVFFGVTAFFFAITISFPLCLTIMSWIIYGLSLLAIIICNCPTPLFHE